MTQSENEERELQRQIGDLWSSVISLMESFRKLKAPLIESHQKMPQATTQLDKITEQTEAAAHRMLDMVEKIIQREQEIIEGLADIKGLAGGKKGEKMTSLIADIEQKANTNLNDTYTIVDALQFQDITSQQMNHAAALLEEIGEKLQHILGMVGAEETETKELATKCRAFDPHADLFDRRTEQSDIDSLFAKRKHK